MAMKRFFDQWSVNPIYKDLYNTYKELDYGENECCKTCKETCCMQSPCSYYPEDFERLSPKILFPLLEKGEISIRATVTSTLLLYLRARGVNRPIVDLFSLDTSCQMVDKEKGCKYDFHHRPSGGNLLIPHFEGEKCGYPGIETETFLKSWSLHQVPLQKAVKYFTGNTLEEEALLEIKEILENQKAKNDEERKHQMELAIFAHLYPPTRKAIRERKLILPTKF